ncbi:MAG: DUF1320 domain-containing protein [Pseudomonadota bacterium]
MAYATLADLERRLRSTELVQIADLDEDGVADADVVADALADAGNEIDAYLSGRYDLPLNPVPDLVTLWAVFIARYRLWSAKDDMPDLVRTNYQDAIRQLTMVQRGDIILESAAKAEPAERASQAVRGTTAAKVFAGGGLKGFLS